MTAGTELMSTLTIAKKPCPLIVWRTWSRIWLAFSAEYRADSVRWRLNDFDSRMPDTLSVSWVIEVSSDSDCCVSLAIRARTWPTRRWTMTSTGVITSEMIVRRQSIRTIATIEAITVTAFPRMLVTVLVSTPETPPTSFCSLDWITPVLVRVKNASSMFCRWSNMRTRRSPATRLPTLDVSQVCTTCVPAASTYNTIMRPTSRPSRLRSTSPEGGNRASSKTRWITRGGITPSPAPTTTSSAVIATRRRYGRNSATIRFPRSGTRGAAAFAFRCADSSIGRIPRPPPIGRPILIRLAYGARTLGEFSREREYITPISSLN